MSDKETRSPYASLRGLHRAVPIILFAAAAFIAVCFVTSNAGVLGDAISGLLLGLFSYGAYAIPPLTVIHGLFYASDVEKKRGVTRLIFSTVTVIGISALSYAVSHWSSGDVFDVIGFYDDGRSGVGGGLIGGAVGFLIGNSILGPVGTVIITVAIIAIYITFFFSRDRNVFAVFFLGILKGLITVFAFIENKLKGLFGRRKGRSAKQSALDSERSRELMDDEFFDVDNGMQHLEISELGISESRDRADTEARGNLHEKVHIKSAVKDEPLDTRNYETYREPEPSPTEQYTEAREEPAPSSFYVLSSPRSTNTAERVRKAQSGIGAVHSTDRESVPMPGSGSASFNDADGYSVRTASGGRGESSADALFTSDFDPFALAMSEKLASKPSSRSLLDERRTVTESISEITEEDLARARRIADFEKRKTEIVNQRRAEQQPVNNSGEYNGPEKNMEFRMSSAEDLADRTEDCSHISLTLNKSDRAPTADSTALPEDAVYDEAYEPEVPDNAPLIDSDAATDMPRAEYEDTPRSYTPTYTAAQQTRAMPTRDSRASYRRAAEFAGATMQRENAAPTAEYRRDYLDTAKQTYATQEPAPTAEYRRDYLDTAKQTYATQEPAPTVISEEYTTLGYGTEHSEYTEAAEFKPYTPPPAEEQPSGLIFEYNERVQPERGEQQRSILTQRTLLCSDEDTEEEYEPISDTAEQGFCGEEYDTSPEEDEVELGDGECEELEAESDDGEWCEREIPPEKRNPAVAEMRDMFTALRDESCEPAADDTDTVCDADADTSDEEYYEVEDEPPFEPEPVPVQRKAQSEEPKKKAADYSDYVMPPLDLLGLDSEQDDEEITAEINENTKIIIETLASFNVTASIKGVDRGPRITRYEVVPAKGVKVNQITHLFDDITLNLAADGIRMEAPIPGKSAIGFEIPNKNPANVRLRELLECDEFTGAKSNTFVCIGKDVAGNPVFGDIAKFPHALIAGATGMGKSVSINSIMISMLYKARPDQVKFIMIDPKKVEFRMYSGIPHLLIPVITEAKQAAGALMWAVEEMERRYDLIEKLNIRNIEAYNDRQERDPSIGPHMPKIVIVIDELNDLMMQVRDPVEDLIMRIAQKARAAGIHLIIGTQRPDVKVITGTIKANINTRISCKVTSVVDSRTILEMAGAEKLLNRGDMLFKPVDKTKPIRVQGAFVSDSEVEAIMNFLKEQSSGGQYDDEIFAEINKAAQKCGNKKSGGGGDDDFQDDDEGCGFYNDQKFLDAVELAIRSGKISTSLLQRKMSIGYGKAAKYIDAMEEIGVVSEPNGQKARDVLLSLDEWYEKLSRVNAD